MGSYSGAVEYQGVLYSTRGGDTEVDRQYYTTNNINISVIEPREFMKVKSIYIAKGDMTSAHAYIVGTYRGMRHSVRIIYGCTGEWLRPAEVHPAILSMLPDFIGEESADW